MNLFSTISLIRFFAYIGMPQLVHWFCFDLSHKINKVHWIDGNRQFFSSGKYRNGKKHGEFRKYNAEGEPIIIENTNSQLGVTKCI